MDIEGLKNVQRFVRLANRQKSERTLENLKKVQNAVKFQKKIERFVRKQQDKEL